MADEIELLETVPLSKAELSLIPAVLRPCRGKWKRIDIFWPGAEAWPSPNIFGSRAPLVTRHVGAACTKCLNGMITKALAKRHGTIHFQWPHGIPIAEAWNEEKCVRGLKTGKLECSKKTRGDVDVAKECASLIRLISKFKYSR